MDQSADEVLSANLADVLENGPGLKARPTAHLRLCSGGKHTLVGGLGCFGIGTMWQTRPKWEGDPESDPIDNLPVVFDRYCGCQVFAVKVFACLTSDGKTVKLDHVGVYFDAEKGYPNPYEWPEHLHNLKGNVTWIPAGEAWGHSRQEAYNHAMDNLFADQPLMKLALENWVRGKYGV